MSEIPYNAGDIVNVNSSEGDVKCMYVKSVDNENKTITALIMCKRYEEIVPFENIIDIVEKNDTTSFLSRLSICKEVFI